MTDRIFPADTVVRITCENVTEGYAFSSWDEPLRHWYFVDVDDEADTITLDMGRMFRSLQREYGACTGRVYVDRGDEAVPIGWHFTKKMRYEDTGEPYMRGVWVSLAVKHPVRYEAVAA